MGTGRALKPDEQKEGIFREHTQPEMEDRGRREKGKHLENAARETQLPAITGCSPRRDRNHELQGESW